MQTALPVRPSWLTPTAPTCHKLPGSSKKRCAASLLPPASLSDSSNSSQRSQTSISPRVRSVRSGITGSSPSRSLVSLRSASLTEQAPTASARTTTSMPPGSPVSRTRTPEMSTAPGAGSPGGPCPSGACTKRSSASLRAAPACASSPARYWRSKDLRSSAHSLRAPPLPKIFCSTGSFGGNGGSSSRPKRSRSCTWHLRKSV
mmetsp:Transcript_73152/g.214362  ORF Transcript_73152/g.214362 Transcript_73152/m.214362 type:complete len:203 (-) Transcript_73152:299-907(-)